MIRFVNAKLNLGLNIIRKREDGYHELETLFYPVSLYNGTPANPEPFCDILEVCRSDSGSDEFAFTGNRIDCPPEKNLVWKALSAFREATGVKGYYKIDLDKHIPDGAGLGGGSADATFTLSALNSLEGEILDSDELKAIAVRLGADCPFFVENRPVFASGIGEIMRPADVSLKGFWALIVKPDVYISTREAFAGITPKIPEIPIPDIVSHPVEEWCQRGLKNDFEPHIFAAHPELSEIKACLYSEGALYASMSGSGSSIFGIYKEKDSAERAAESFKNRHRVFLCLL